MEKEKILEILAEAKKNGKGVLVFCSAYIFAHGKIQPLDHVPGMNLSFRKDFQNDDSFIGPSFACCHPNEERLPYVVPLETIKDIAY